MRRVSRALFGALLMAISFIGSAVGSSSPNTATTITLPTLNADDLIIIATAVGDTADNGIPAPTGYSRVPGVAATLYSNDVNDTNLDLYYKIAVGGDSGATVTLTATGGTNASNAGVAMVFRGVDTTTPFDTDANTATGISTSNADPPSHDWSGTAGAWTVIAASTGHTGGATASFTFPTNYTTDAAQRAHNDTIDVLVGMGYRTSPADPENPGAFTAATIGTAADNAWAAVTMSLKLAVVNNNLTAESGSYSVTGTAADLELGRLVTADSGSYALAGTEAALAVGHPLVADSGTYGITGTDATLLAARIAAADSGAYAIAGTDASVELGRAVIADSGSYVLTGQDATLIYTPAGATYVITADSGAYGVTGSAASLLKGSTLAAESGSYTITGTAGEFIHSVPPPPLPSLVDVLRRAAQRDGRRLILWP